MGTSDIGAVAAATVKGEAIGTPLAVGVRPGGLAFALLAAATASAVAKGPFGRTPLMTQYGTRRQLSNGSSVETLLVIGKIGIQPMFISIFQRSSLCSSN